MIINFEDRDWDFQLEEIDLKQAIAIQLAYGFTLDDWYQALEHSDARALQCLYWLMLQQNGVIKPIAECNCKIMALGEAMAAAQEAAAAAAKAAEAAEPEPDPTQPPSLTGAPSPEQSSRPDTTQPRQRSHAAAAATG